MTFLSVYVFQLHRKRIKTNFIQNTLTTNGIIIYYIRLFPLNNEARPNDVTRFDK